MNLRKIMGLTLALAMGLAVEAQQVNIRGKVSDASGKAIANAVLDLPLLKKKDTTAADGAYAFNFMVTALRSDPERHATDIVMAGGMLRLSLAEPLPVKVEVFDVNGNLLDRKSLDNAGAGVYQMDLGGSYKAENLLIIKASIGPEVKVFRRFPIAQAGGKSGFSKVSVRSAALAKVAATIDTLKVSASGFAPKSVVLTSYDTTLNVTLEPAGDYWGGLKNPPGNSAGCGKATTVTNGKKTIMSSNQQRSYIIDIPSGYDMNKPYRFFYCSHWIGARAEDVVGQNFYWLKTQAAAANEPAIFLAAQALPGNPGGTWKSGPNDSVDNVLFMDILDYVKQNLCIDTTRVFATGFSFGGMMTYSLSENRQLQIRAAVGISAANWNIYVPPKKHLPIAWMGTTGLVNEGLTPWVNNDARKEGGKYINLGHAEDNGCTIPTTDFPTWKSGAHVCYDFQGCKPGYPVKACTFGGGHTSENSDPGSNVNWIPQESWKFFTQF